jgi:hypothetical protein
MEQMMDLCLDEIYKIVVSEKVGMLVDLVDKVVKEMDIVPLFTYRNISKRMKNDGRFEIFQSQIKYLDILPIEYSSKFYKSMGVITFKKILQRYSIPCSTRKIILKGKSLSSIENLSKQMIDSEQGHTLGFELNIVLAILFGTLRDIQFALWLTVFNVIMNLYPVFVQRFNRNRIRLLIEKRYSK